jgi:hypothetical protein
LKRQGADIDSQRFQFNKDLTAEFGLHVTPEHSDILSQTLNAIFGGLVSQLPNNRHKQALEFQQSHGEHLLAFAQEFFCLQLRTNKNTLHTFSAGAARLKREL